MVNRKGHIRSGTRFIDIYTCCRSGGLIGFPIYLRTRLLWAIPRRRKATQTTYGEQHRHRGNPFAWAALAIVIVAVIAFFAVLAFHGYPAGPGPYYGYSWYGWWFFPFGIFFFIIFLFFVSRLIFWPMGWGWRRMFWFAYVDGHVILRQRYARGEITKEQFDQMRRELEQH